MKIKKPIFVILDDNTIVKYETLDFASNDLEAYDIPEYRAFDSDYQILELYQKDVYNRVGFKPTDSKFQFKEIQKHLSYTLSIDKNKIENENMLILLNKIQSQEVLYKEEK